MYESVRMRNFRAFDEITVDGLTRINLITGRNDVGKTCLLEAMYLLAAVANPYAPYRLQECRGLLAEPGDFADNPFASLFHDFRWWQPVEIDGHGRFVPADRFRLAMVRVSGDGEVGQAEFGFGDPADTGGAVPPTDLSAELSWARGSGKPAVMRISDMERYAFQGRRYPAGYDRRQRSARDDGALTSDRDGVPVFVPTRLGAPPREEARRFKSLVLGRRQDDITAAMHIIDERITDTLLLPFGEQLALYVDVGLRSPIPLALLGEGAQRLASLALAFADAAQTVIVVDEIDTGLHHSVLEQMWAFVASASVRFDAQVFASTHSFECAAAAARVFGDSALFSAHRLERIRGHVRHIAMDSSHFASMVQSGYETR